MNDDNHKKKKYYLVAFIAIMVAFIAFALAENAQQTADINNVYELVDNNTNVGCGESGTCEVKPNVLYYANTSPLNVYMKFHVTNNNAHVVANITVNGTIKSWRDFTTVQADQNDSMFVQVPKNSSWKIQNSSTIHHVEIYLSNILSGKNGTLSINQSLVGSSFNSTYAANISALQANDTYFNGSIFPQSKDFRNNTLFDFFDSGKVNKSGDNMTGRLAIGNASQATVELFVIERETDPAAFRIETNSSQGGAFFGARYNGFRADNQTPVLKNEILFHLSGLGTQTNNTYSGVAAEIRVVADENFSSTKHPGSIEFWTAPNVTSATNAKRWKIETNGSLWPAANNQYEIGNATAKVKNLSIALTAEGSTLDAVCYDGTKLFYNPGVATCTASREEFKHNITPVSYNPLDLNRFQLVTYDYIVTYPHVIEEENRVDYIEKTVKRYGMTAEQVMAIDPLLVAYDEVGNPTGIHYEDLAAYLMNVTQSQQQKLDKICSNQPSLCQ